MPVFSSKGSIPAEVKTELTKECLTTPPSPQGTQHILMGQHPDGSHLATCLLSTAHKLRTAADLCRITFQMGVQRLADRTGSGLALKREVCVCEGFSRLDLFRMRRTNLSVDGILRPPTPRAEFPGHIESLRKQSPQSASIIAPRFLTSDLRPSSFVLCPAFLPVMDCTLEP